VTAWLLPWGYDNPDPSLRVRVHLRNGGPQTLRFQQAEVTFLDGYGQPLFTDRLQVKALAPGAEDEVVFFFSNTARLAQASALLYLRYAAGETEFEHRQELQVKW
jgi:hypothetical protein